MSYLFYKYLSYTLFLLFISCGAITRNTPSHISKSCDLLNHIDQTVIIKGIFSRCMEYSSFKTIEIDSCSDYFKMDLDLNHIVWTDEIERNLDLLEGCGLSMEMTIKGILRKGGKYEYGHLNSNNSKIIVHEFLEFGEIKRLNLQLK